MGKGTLITRPNHDLATTYLFYWSKPLVEIAKNEGIQILDLAQKKASLGTLSSYIENRKPRFIFLNGHGGPDYVCGYDDEVIVNLDNCKELLNGTIVYARSCESGLLLGPECIKTGTLAFIGYSRKFIVGYLEEKQTRPLNDNVAKLFLEPSNLIALYIMRGNSVKIACEKARSLMIRNFTYMLSRSASSDEKDAAVYLWSNIKHLVTWGNTEAKV
ncbi:MAG: hypothetical protein Q7R49_00030 [Candidatus Daviesbacteria bacterium]|nr:hypothetical protein [Candidatus Daviesbacteria bacterium]